MSSVLKVDEIQNTDGKTGLVITPDGSIDGIKFPEQLNPSGRTITGTTMSSYEEGTWKPVVNGDVDSNGIYTKIGRQVTLIAFIRSTDQSTDAGIEITGLPFTVANLINSTTHESQGSISHHVGYLTGYQAGFAVVRSGGAGLLDFRLNDSIQTQLKYKDHNETWNIRVTLTYFTNS